MSGLQIWWWCLIVEFRNSKILFPFQKSAMCARSASPRWWLRPGWRPVDTCSTAPVSESGCPSSRYRVVYIRIMHYHWLIVKYSVCQVSRTSSCWGTSLTEFASDIAGLPPLLLGDEGGRWEGGAARGLRGGGRGGQTGCRPRHVALGPTGVSRLRWLSRRILLLIDLLGFVFLVLCKAIAIRW